MTSKHVQIHLKKTLKLFKNAVAGMAIFCGGGCVRVGGNGV